MKTLNEILLEVKNLSNKINELCIDIDGLKDVEGANIKVGNDKIKSMAKRYPITGHPLCNVDEYTQKLYLALLASIGQLESSNFEHRLLFISRIIEGTNKEIEINGIIKNSMELNEKIIDEFTLAIIEKGLSINFAVDSIILANLNVKCGGEVLEYISTLFQMLRISKEEVVELVQLAIIILERNKNKYKEFCHRELNIDLEKFLFYIIDFYEGIICNNSRLFHLEYKSQREVEEESNIQKIELIKAKKVFISNIIMNNIGNIPKFEGCEEVRIANSYFDNSSKSINFNKCKNIIINNVYFKKFSDRALCFHECFKANVINCIFDSCQHKSYDEYSYGYQSSAYGGAIYSDVSIIL